MGNGRSTSLSGTSRIAIPNQEFADEYPSGYSSNDFQIPGASPRSEISKSEYNSKEKL
jgi:hypothetical protein